MYFIFMYTYFIIPIHGLDDSQISLIKSLINKFFIKNCILITDSEDKLAALKDFKEINTWNVLVNVKSQKELYKYLYSKSPDGIYPYRPRKFDLDGTRALQMPKTMIIFQKSTLKDIRALFDNVKSTVSTLHFIWVALLQESEEEFLNFVKSKNGIQIMLRTEFFFTFRKNSTSFKLIESYVVKSTARNCIINDYGTWDAGNGLKTSDLSYHERRSDMNGTLLLFRDMVTHTRLPSSIEDARLRSKHIQILHYISEMLNFRGEVVPWNYRDRSFTVLEIVYNMVASMYVREQIGPVLKAKSFIYIREPDILVSNKFFILPFHLDLWVAVLASLLFFTFSLILSYYLIERHQPEKHLGLIDFCFMAFESVCNQSGCENLPISLGGKIILYTLGLFTLIILSYYSAELLSYLLLRSFEPPFEDLRGLLKKNDSWYLGWKWGGLVFFFMRHEKQMDPLLRDLMEHSFEPFKVNDPVEGLQRACNGSTAFIESEHNVNYLPLNCNIYKVPNPVLISQTAIKFSEYTGNIQNMFFYKLLWLYTSGIIDRMQRDFAHDVAVKSSDTKSPVEMEHVIYLLCLVALGLILSLTFFIFETSWKYFAKCSSPILGWNFVESRRY